MTLNPAYETSIGHEAAREFDWRTAAEAQDLSAHRDEEYIAREIREQR